LPGSPADEPKALPDDVPPLAPPLAAAPAMVSSAGATTAGVAPGPTATPAPGAATGASADSNPAVGSEDAGAVCCGAGTGRPLPRLEGFRAGFALGLGLAFGPATALGSGFAVGRAAGDDERGVLDAGVTKPVARAAAEWVETEATVSCAGALIVPVVVGLGVLVVVPIGLPVLVVVVDAFVVVLVVACETGAAAALAAAAFPARPGDLAASGRTGRCAAGT
jgi:hypothetical protein